MPTLITDSTDESRNVEFEDQNLTKNSMKDTIEIDGEEYTRTASIAERAHSLDGKPHVIIRSADSGCHAGYVEYEEGNTITLIKSRRLWYWDGAASLSQLAVDGPQNPENCKFPCEVDRITVYQVCEKIETTEQAHAAIASVPVWKK